MQAPLGFIRGKWNLSSLWRAVTPDGELFAESSDEAEIRRLAREVNGTVQRRWGRTDVEWKED